jgi:acyl-CoA reductase-like NAD-dependent aldehyde dehydrogenase
VPHRSHFIEYRPFGVVAVIAPWNFPVILSIAPIYAALLTGNAVIYKPSEFAPQTGEIIRKVIHEAGIAPDLFQTVQGYGDLGAALIKARPNKICFTGSVPTGRKVAAAAGELLIPVTLELGGKDAAIVLADADIDRTAAGLAWAGMTNAGQACLSVERIYVERVIADELVEKMRRIITDNLAPDTSENRTLGAITNETQMKIIEGQVDEAIAQGARIICGGKRVEGRGRFYAPTLITDVRPEMRVVKDETFGPVIAVIPVDSSAEAIRLANDTRFGLTGSVWTRNRKRGLEIARQLVAANIAVNDHIISASVPSLPWGGVGDSGYGRERGPEGLLDMVYPQALSVDRVTLPREPYWYPHTPLKYNIFRRILRVLYADSFVERIRALFR